MTFTIRLFLALTLLCLATEIASADQPTNPDGPIGGVVITLSVQRQVEGELKIFDTKIAETGGNAFSADFTLPVAPRATILGGITRYSANADYIYSGDQIDQTAVQLTSTRHNWC